MVTAAISGALDIVKYRHDDLLNLDIPTQVEGVPSEILDPKHTWVDKDSYDLSARKLAQMFVDNFKKFENVSDYYLFDTKTNLHGGSGKKFNWEILKNYNSKKYFFLSGGISENDIEEIKKIRKIYPIIGIDINSKFELPNLKKDRAKIKSLIDKI